MFFPRNRSHAVKVDLEFDNDISGPVWANKFDKPMFYVNKFLAPLLPLALEEKRERC